MRKLVIAFALLAVACGVSPQHADEKAAAKSSSIIDGTASSIDQDSVLLITIAGRGGCTGTLVAPNLVLTARHCVTQTSGGAVCKTDGTAYDGGELGSNFSVGSLLVYKGQLASAMADDPSKASAKGKQLFVETTSTYCDSDVAFILLDRNVSAPVAPIRLTEGAREGELVTAVGWGLTEEGRLPSKRLQRAGIKVEGVGPLSWDSSTDIGLAKSEFMTGEGTCSGDSGGPAFASTGAVVGVVSRGGNGEEGGGVDSCLGANTIGIYTHLAHKRTLVDRAFKASGYQVRDEGTPPGLIAGEACVENVDCSSNTCVSKVCRTPCTEDTECEAEEKCTPKGELMICMPAPADAPPAEEGGEDTAAAAPAQGATTKTTTTTCAAAPGGASGGISGLAFALAAAALVFLRRSRRG
jgi:MYXO-CTERM domain-containing protein